MLCVTSAQYLKITFSFFAMYTGNTHLYSLKKKKVWERHVGKSEKSYVLLKEWTFFRIKIVICSKKLHNTVKYFVML